MTKPVPVTDHAVLRWLERECDVPVEQIRRLIGEGCAPGARLGARAVIWGRTKFVIVDGHVVTTVPIRPRKGRRHVRRS